MASRDKKDAEPTKQPEVNTARLEALAAQATQAAQAKQWRARKSGFQDPGEPSEVRDLSQDADARAQAEAAMRQMMAKAGGKRRGR